MSGSNSLNVAACLAALGEILLVVPVKWIAVAAIYFTLLVSSISAIDYFVGFWKKIDHASKDSRKRKAFVLSRNKRASLPGETQ